MSVAARSASSRRGRFVRVLIAGLRERRDAENVGLAIDRTSFTVLNAVLCCHLLDIPDTAPRAMLKARWCPPTVLSLPVACAPVVDATGRERERKFCLPLFR